MLEFQQVDAVGLFQGGGVGAGRSQSQQQAQRQNRCRQPLRRAGGTVLHGDAHPFLDFRPDFTI